MKHFIFSIRIVLAFTTVSCDTTANQENGVNSPINNISPSPQSVNTAFKGVKHFELEYPNSASKYEQNEEECKTLCEKTCGGKCLEYEEVLHRCFKENPKLKRGNGGRGGKEDAQICYENVPSIYTKYPFWFRVFYPQSAPGVPRPETVGCRVTCN